MSTAGVLSLRPREMCRSLSLPLQGNLNRLLVLRICGKGCILVRRTTMALVRQGIAATRGVRFLVTWDVDSHDRTTADRVYVFVWGKKVRRGAKVYEHAGFARQDGARYIGQSTLFVRPNLLSKLVNFLEHTGIDHAIDRVAFL